MRSLWPKIKNFATDLHEREADISFLCEVWEKCENKKHKKMLEEMLEMSNIKYISTPRPGVKRGGGAAIVVNGEKYSVSKLNIRIPKPLEVVWAILKVSNPNETMKNIILCSFYSPPNSKKNGQLIDHIAQTYQELMIQHPEARIIFSGDKNSLDEKKTSKQGNYISRGVSSSRKRNISILAIKFFICRQNNHVVSELKH